MVEFILASLLVFIGAITAFFCMIMFWYNGTLNVSMEEDGDNLKLDINEYDLIRNRRFMILLINKNKK